MSLLHYITYKLVIIRDRRIGSIYYTIAVLIVFYTLAEIFLKKGYLEVLISLFYIKFFFTFVNCTYAASSCCGSVIFQFGITFVLLHFSTIVPCTRTKVDINNQLVPGVKLNLEILSIQGFVFTS